MAKEQYLDLAGLTTYDEEIKSHIETVADEKADIQHNHTVSEITDLLDLTEEEIAELCEFDGNPDNIIPIASKASMGCVVAGDGLDIDDNGVLSVQSLTDEEIESICEFDEGMTEDNVIPKATKTALGCIKVGDGLAIDSAGRLSATGGGGGVATAGIGSAGMKLLWENENPTASFAPQTIELDLSEYDEIAIDFIYSGTYSSGISRTVFQKDVQKAACMAFIGNVLRLTTCTDTGVEFGYGEYYTTYNSVNSITQENLIMIPQRIYGVDVAPPNVDYTLTEEKDISNELLWENPSPTTSFAAQTVALDLSEYDEVEVQFSDTSYRVKLRIGDEVSRTYSRDNYFTYRNIRATSTGIVFGTGGYYGAYNSGNPVTGDGYAIPYRIYGIKNKINVTTAVVTDKGQHTDLLWENASPSADFGEQTIKIDGISEYSMIQVVAKENKTVDTEVSAFAHIGMNGALRLFYNYRNARNFKYDTSDNVWFGSCGEANYNSTMYTADNSLIPIRIYGIKHNAATTSTIMGDYVVEEGTSGIWTYQKWASGRAKLVGQWLDVYGSAVNADANGSITIDFPFTFTSRMPAQITPYYQAWKIGKTYDNSAGNTNGKFESTGLEQLTMIFWLTNQGYADETYGFVISVDGRWK